MKILHVCLANYYADGHSYQENLLPVAHKRMGYEVEILASTETFNDLNALDYVTPSQYYSEDEILITRIPYIKYIPSFLQKKLRIYKGVVSQLTRINPDIIFIHDVQFLSVFSFVKLIKKQRKNHSIKVFADCHADFTNSARNFFSYWFLHKLIYRPCALALNQVVDKFWGVLPSRVDFLEKVYGIPRNKIGLLSMGVDSRWAQAAGCHELKSSYRKKYGFNASDIVIATGGRIDSFKKQTLAFMYEFRRLNFRNLRLVVFGTVSSDLEKEFFDLIRSDDRIVYVGFLCSSGVVEILLSSDLGVFMGRHSVIWEQAVGVGLPLILGDRGLASYLNHQDNIYFADSSRSAVDHIDRLIICDEMQRFKTNAQADTRFMFSYENIAKKSLEI